MGLVLGLDLGITSVGYGIVDENDYRIVDYGVRLFEEGTADENLTRRMMRSGRRLKGRRQNRINAIKYLLKNNNIIDTIDFEPMNNIYELKVKGLTEKLTPNELANVLVNYAKRRGSSLEVVVDEDNMDDAASASALTNNTKYLLNNNMYICEYQLSKIKNGEKLRKTDNVFRTEEYKKELDKILSNQGLSEELNEKIREIIFRRREFSEGPGSLEFPTPYGSYRIKFENGKKIIEHVNLIEIMRGKCSIFPDEPRIAKNTYTASLFNLLNDLNNLTIDGEIKLTPEQKKEIISNYIDTKGKITIAQLCKYLGVTEEQLSGLRTNPKGNKLITTFDGYIKLLPILPSSILANKDNVDNIIEVVTKTIVLDERIKELEELNLGLGQETIQKLASITKINGYHSLSKKAMNAIIPEMLETSKNQMVVITENHLGENLDSFEGPNIPFNDKAILSPVAKRVHRQALRVVNELRKEYKEFSAIVIETTRAKNSKEEKDKEIEVQKRNLENKKRTEELLLDMDKNPDDYNTLTKLKLVLYKQQQGKTIYAGLPIDLNVLLNDETAYQIEHIIPYAVSFDNSLNNKALASATENQDKGKKSPWGYFSSGKVSKLNGPIKTWEDFEAFVSSLNLPSKKKENLLNQKDISKFDNMQEFVARNLNDTSYGIRTVMTSMKDYFKFNNIPTKVFTTKGKLTHDFRQRVGLSKDRDEYIHHAVDALIIAGSKSQKVFNNAYELESSDGITYLKETGEIVDVGNDPFEDGRFIRFVSSLKQIKGEPKDFSYKVDKKTNRSFADQTIYSTRNYDDKEYIIKKYKDIYGQEGEKLKDLFVKGTAKDKLLIAKNDSQTFEILEKVYESYKNEKNPFAKYKEEFGPIHKFSKKGNGPEINQVKYIDSELGNYLDISHKYETKDKKVVLLNNSPYRTDIYISPEGVYKMVTVRRYNIKQINGKNVIDSKLYQELKDKKKITDNDRFLFSLNKNDIVNFVTKSDLTENISQNEVSRYYRFVGTNNDIKNRIELKNIEKNTANRNMPTVGKSVIKFEKYNVSPAGKWSKVQAEDLKLVW